MKILHTVEFYHPSVGGMQEVVKQLSERLVKLGHDVTVATTKLPARAGQTVNGVKIVEFAVSGNLVRGLSGDVQAYRDFLLRSDFDVVTNFAAQQWATDVMITMLDKIKAKMVFVPTGFSGLYNRQYQDYFVSMKTWMKQYDMNVFLSETYRDMMFAREHGVEKLKVIPNGASEDEFLPETGTDIRSRLKIPDDNFLVLHVGSHTGIKGHRETFRIFGNARIADATLLIVANDFGGGCGRECRVREFLFNKRPGRRSAGKRVIMTELTRPETIAAYKTADLFLFPSNVECSPLVLFECMASKTPFLTTDVGNAKEIVEWSQAGKVLPTM
jgi:glycosyltransferase involved in cell wall biosynthesis